MSLLEQTAARLRALLSAETDQALVRARASGEQLVAVIRLLFIGAFSLFVGFNLSPATRTLELAFITGAQAYGALLLWAAVRIRGEWLSWVTCAVDVTLITASLALYAAAGLPVDALNNRAIFEAYFFVMVISALRYDWRLCAFTSGLIFVEFLGLTAYVTSHWDLTTLQSPGVGRFTAFSHTLRLIVLAGVGFSVVVVARWARHLRLMVGTDHLTGLSQRRPFLERVEEELQRSDGGQGVMSFALLDVDEFKKFNDTHGHLAGDRALQLLAGRLRKSVRAGDLVARFGGEEFVIAFPRMEVARAIRRVNELRTELSSVPIPVSGQVFHLTLSGGVGSWPTDGRDFETVLARVDERLYEAKKQGRNRVVGPASQLLAAGGS